MTADDNGQGQRRWSLPSWENSRRSGREAGPHTQRKAFVYEALQMVIDYGVRVLGLVEVRVRMTSGKVSMRTLMEKRFGTRLSKMTLGLI